MAEALASTACEVETKRAPVAVAGSASGSPQPLAELDSSALEAVPVISADARTIDFLSTPAPTIDGDIDVATRGRTLYMSSSRLGTSDTYVARRPK